MTYPTIESRNYDLDHEIAEVRSITLDQLDALPLSTVELLREQFILKSPEQWGLDKNE